MDLAPSSPASIPSRRSRVRLPLAPFRPIHPGRCYVLPLLAHGSPHGGSAHMRAFSCAHLLPCTQELSTPPDPPRPLAALHSGAPASSPLAQNVLFMGHALVRSYVVSWLQPVCSPCSCHCSRIPGPASGILFALARCGAATARRRRPCRCPVRPFHWRLAQAARRLRRRPLRLDSAFARLQLDRPFPAIRA